MFNYKDLKIGQRVWSINYGWGTILSMNAGEEQNLIQVRFDEGARCWLYDYEGNRNQCDVTNTPTLFLNEFKIPEAAFKERNYILDNDYEVSDLIMFKFKNGLNYVGQIESLDKINGYVTICCGQNIKSFKINEFLSSNIQFFEMFKPTSRLEKSLKGNNHD